MGNPLDIVVAGQIRDAHATAGSISDNPPPPLPGRGPFKVADVAGRWTRAVAASHHFADTVSKLPLGPVLVTMRLEPNEANPYGINAYVAGEQVGWLTTDWSARDKHIVWMKRLDAAGILPRFQALVRLQPDGDRIINFDMPGRDDGRLGDIARRLIAASGQS